jgi:cation diffusion facilitator CzcD-associated flavoprotein CzcO
VSLTNRSNGDLVYETIADPATPDARWAEEFDAVIIANGHYSVPFVRHLVPRAVMI